MDSIFFYISAGILVLFLGFIIGWLLNKIPYVSRLFKNTGVGRETESLMLMVTPRIIIQEEEEELLGL